MVLDQEVKIKVNSNHLKHYIELGYDAKCRELLIVNPIHLPKGSHYKINVCCDICNNKKNIEFRQLKEDLSYICRECSQKNKIKVIWSEEMLQNMKNKITETVNKKKEKNPDLNNNINKKRKQTKLEKYGDENYTNQVKRKKTFIERYEDGYFINQEKRKQTFINRYGIESFNNQEKKKETCQSKYGVDYTTQIYEVFEKIQKSGFLIKLHDKFNIYYRGTYEKDFLDFCFTNNINVINFKKTIYYFYEDKKRRYYPDFYHIKSNTIIEIKSNYTYNKDLDKNLLKKESCISLGYNFMFIIDKKYEEFLKIINNIPC